MVMTPEAWTVIGTGIVVLIAIATSYRHLRDEIRGEMKTFRDELRGEMNEKIGGLHARMDRIEAKIGALRERMAKLEGLLEGLREAIAGRKAA